MRVAPLRRERASKISCEGEHVAPTTEQAVRNRLPGYPRIDVDEEVARTAGELLAAADDRSGGEAGVGPNDAYIAAMAELLDDAVLTANVDDFEALGVSVESY